MGITGTHFIRHMGGDQQPVWMVNNKDTTPSDWQSLFRVVLREHFALPNVMHPYSCELQIIVFFSSADKINTRLLLNKA